VDGVLAGVVQRCDRRIDLERLLALLMKGAAVVAQDRLCLLLAILRRQRLQVGLGLLAAGRKRPRGQERKADGGEGRLHRPEA
jgi:hypothetical protein